MVVAVLSIFSVQHELSTPGTISTFLSFFVVIHWVWVMQVHYDIRYEAEDLFHRWVCIVDPRIELNPKIRKIGTDWDIRVYGGCQRELEHQLSPRSSFDT